VIYPINYEPLTDLAQGVFALREKTTGKEFLGVSFGVESGLGMVTLETCCWPLPLATLDSLQAQ